jgi:hypothetical protein
LRVFVGRDDTGRVRHRSRMFEGTKRVAERELARLVAVVDDERAERQLLACGWGPDTTINQAIEGGSATAWGGSEPNTAGCYERIWRKLHCGLDRQAEDRFHHSGRC